MGKDYFKARFMWLGAMKSLSDSEIGRLFKAIIIYAKTGEEVHLPGNEKIMFPFIKGHIDEDAEIERGRKVHGAVGKYHPNWKGGVTPENQVERKSAAYKAWRLAVFERDEYTCQSCFEQGGELQAHHIHPWADCPDERFSVSNGITLCKRCHWITHHGGG